MTRTTAAEAARVFRFLRETGGDADADVLVHRASLQRAARTGGSDLARDVLALLEPWWREEREPVLGGGSRC